MKSHRFVDAAHAVLRAGDGGNGCLSFRREKYVPRGGPDGGDGGNGGSVILEADPHTDSLEAFYYQPDIRAPDGEHGRGGNKRGANGRDRIVRVPCGTDVRDPDTLELIEALLTPGQRTLLARGGRGGFGNAHFTSSTHRAPTETTPGAPGEERRVFLELRTLADVGLVGLPNAGKSSLLRALTRAKPAVGAYPFTTLYPIVGIMPMPDFGSLRLVDVPGLIQGAHAGAGLGHTFLRHIERTRFLVYVVDMAGSENRNPVEDFRILQNELRLHRADLIRRPCLVAANKCDLPGADINLKIFRRSVRRPIAAISAQTGAGLATFRTMLIQAFQALPPPGGKAPPDGEQT